MNLDMKVGMKDSYFYDDTHRLMDSAGSCNAGLLHSLNDTSTVLQLRTSALALFT